MVPEKVKDGIKIFFQWLLTDLVCIFVFALCLHFLLGVPFGSMREAVDKPNDYLLADRLSNINDIEYVRMLGKETENITDGCVNDTCKVRSIIMWLRYNRTLNATTINPKIKDISSPLDSVNCQDITYAFYIVSNRMGVKTKICVTNTHVFAMSRIDGKWMLVDPTSRMAGDAYPIDDYVLCKW